MDGYWYVYDNVCRENISGYFDTEYEAEEWRNKQFHRGQFDRYTVEYEDFND